jgi:hypothetical protein
MAFATHVILNLPGRVSKEGLNEAQSLFDTALTFLDSCEPITGTDKPSHNTVIVRVSSVCGDFGAVRPLYLVFIIHESEQRSILISSVIQSLLYEYVLSKLS